MANTSFYLETWGRFIPDHLSYREIDAVLEDLLCSQKSIVSGIRSDTRKLERINMDIRTLELSIRARKRKVPLSKKTKNKSTSKKSVSRQAKRRKHRG